MHPLPYTIADETLAKLPPPPPDVSAATGHLPAATPGESGAATSAPGGLHRAGAPGPPRALPARTPPLPRGNPSAVAFRPCAAAASLRRRRRAPRHRRRSARRRVRRRPSPAALFLLRPASSTSSPSRRPPPRPLLRPPSAAVRLLRRASARARARPGQIQSSIETVDFSFPLRNLVINILQYVHLFLAS